MGVYFGTTEITNVDWIPGDKDITQAFLGSTEVFTVWAEYDSTLPAQYSANGDYLADYRIYGASSGVGDYVAPEYKQVHTDTVTIDGIVWDILGYDHDIVYKSDNTLAQHSVTIQVYDVLTEMQFDAKEALFAFDSGLSAGTYHFTVGAQPWYSGDVNKIIQFTLAQALPPGGQLVIGNSYNATMIGATISAFASGTATTATETVTMSEGSDGTDLGTITNGLSQDGTINSIQRALLGSNNWQISAMRQYLNSFAPAGSVWFPQTKWDRPPSWAANIAGFLNGMSADFIANLGTTSKTTALNTVTDGGGTEATLDKVFLLSYSEVYAGNEVTGGEGTAYLYYSDFSDLSAPGTGADNNRIKYRNGTAKYWWLRSPDVGSANIVPNISPTGALNYYVSATHSNGVAPACCIPLDDIETNDWLREKFLKNPSTAYGYEVDMSVQNGNLFDKETFVSTVLKQRCTASSTQTGFSLTATGGDPYIGSVYSEGMSVQSQYRPALIKVTPNTKYTLSASRLIDGYISYIDISFTSIGFTQITTNTQSVTVTTPANTSYLFFRFGKLNAQSGDVVNFDNVVINCGESASYQPYSKTVTPIYIGDEPLGEDEYVDYGEGKIYRMTAGTLTPVDPPVPLPALPTVDGTTIVDYAGHSAAVPSRFVAKYRKEGF